ncbi:MAG: Nitrate reductase [Nitrospira sp.]|jgi:anaerobic selenocysteine-containing dehydrogenase|nr:Nitrate reductase [Nitrospira sp.]
MKLKRRTFIKALGLAAAGSFLPGCEREVHHLVPYVLPDDEIVPGVADWYASTCRECQAGCGVVVRVMEGRAKKIEGNSEHPLNQGKLCAKGQAALQGLYNPDRIREPLRRPEREGRRPFEPLAWEEALTQLTERLRKVQGPVIMISRPLSGTLAELVSTFMRAIDGELYFYEPGADLPLRAASRAAFGMDAWPHIDLAGSDYVLSFGAPFLEGWLSPVSLGIAYGQMRQGRPLTRGRFVQVEPRLSLTGASADRWIPIRPGTAGLLAMGIGQILLAERPSALPETQRRTYERIYGDIPLDRIAALTDIPREELVRTAREFGSAGAPLAIGGGAACAHTNATESLAAIQGLNVVTGRIGRPGGLRFYEPALFSGTQSIPWLTERSLGELAQRALSVVLLYDSNPLHTAPPSIPLRRLFEQADFVASFSPFMDDSTSAADLILPDHSPLESWGDHVQPTSFPTAIVSLSQPVVTPLYDTRAVGDTFLSLAHRLGLSGFPRETFHAFLQDRWRRLLSEQAGTHGEEAFAAAWAHHVQQGGWWGRPGRELTVTAAPPPLPHVPATFDGDDQNWPLYFHPYPSPSLGQGRGANLPWLQELPDALTSAMWGTWAEINPHTAQAHGIRQGDIVRIVSRYGSIEVPALYYPAIRPDVIAVPMGQGHQEYGRYASRRGVNPQSILAPLFDHRTGVLASAATRVRIEATGRPGRPVLLEPSALDPGHELLTIGKARSSP